MLKVAITGNISAGKSVAEKILRDKGFYVFDTDIIAHDVLEKSEDVKKAFSGHDILTDSKIDRKKLAKVVFNNKDELNKLENIIHPLVKQELEKIFSRDYKIVFISVPQLFESGFNILFDKIILVTSDEKLRLERLMRRNNLSEEEAQIRIKSQIPQEEKISRSDFVVENNSSIDFLEEQIDKILNTLLN